MEKVQAIRKGIPIEIEETPIEDEPHTIYGMKNRIGNIGHDAHFGGAMGGYFITLIFEPWVFSEHLLMVVLLFIPLVVLFILQKNGKL